MRILEPQTMYVRPITPESIVSANGLTVQDLPQDQRIGEVVYFSDDLTVKGGDIIDYVAPAEHETAQRLIVIDGELLHTVLEHELLAINDNPYNIFFVETLSDLSVTDGGIEVSQSTKLITQKGKVIKAFENDFCKIGDIVEYRRSGGHAEVYIDTTKCHVLKGSDLYRINDVISPYRILINIDLIARKHKVINTDSGMVIPENWLYMKYNLQYGEILEMGEIAKGYHPELNIGDTIIIHHSVESQAQDFRLLKTVYNVANMPIAEHRMLNAYFNGNNEIFGKIVTEKQGENKIRKIVPIFGHIFCNKRFEIMYDFSKGMTKLFDMEHDYSKANTLVDFMYAREHLMKEYTDKRQALLSGYQIDSQQIRSYDPNNPYTQDEIDYLQDINRKMQEVNMDAEKTGAYVKANFICKIRNHNDKQEHFLVPINYLYPITLFGKEYIKIHKDMIIAKQNTNIMNNEWRPVGNTVFIEPIEEKSETLLEVPENSAVLTKKGIITHVGDKVTALSVGETITYVAITPMTFTVDGKDLLAIPETAIKAAK